MTHFLPVRFAQGACVAAVVLIAGQASAQPAEKPGQPAARKKVQFATAIWNASCVSCHGEKGDGGKEKKAPSLLSDAKMAESLDRPFFDMLKKAEGPHEAAKGLSDQEAWSLVVHLRELQTDDRRKRVGSPKPDKAGVYASQRAKFKIETVIDSGLETPWAIEWLPPRPSKVDDGPARVLVTEKDGVLDVYEGGKHVGKVAGLPKLVSRGQGGLMDVAAHPEYAQNGWVYLSFAEPSDDGKREMTKVVRGRLSRTAGGGNERGFTFVDQQVIFQPKPQHYVGPGVHYGSRIVFEKPAANQANANGRWYVHFSVGERGGNEQAQQLERPNGKMHRLWDDGQVPSDNPFAQDASNAYPSIWSKGHRNQQGVCFDDEGNLWVTEHGPRGGDELNLITKGANYGWPQVCFGINYSDQPFVTPWKEKANDGTAITLPVHRWIRSIAACGLDCAHAAKVKTTFPDWSGDLFAGGLAAETVQRVRVKDGKMAECEEIVHGMGRVRDVAFGPDGCLYIVLNGPDKVVRVVPAK